MQGTNDQNQTDKPEEFIDPVTGEIIEIDPTKVSAKELTSALTSYGRWIISATNKMSHLTDPMSRDCSCKDCALGREVKKLTDLFRMRVEEIESKRQKLLNVAEHLVLTGGEEKVILRGTGRFRFRKLTNTVLTDGWDTMSEEIQGAFAVKHKSLITETIKLAPDRKAIKAALSGPEGDKLKGTFILSEDRTKFEFKAE